MRSIAYTNAQATINLWKRILVDNAIHPQNILEFGCGVGKQLFALLELFPTSHIVGYEINKNAAEKCRQYINENETYDKKRGNIKIYNASLLDSHESGYDFVFTSGLLVALKENDLWRAYEKMYEASKRYILFNEYFNPVPLEINYRGHANRLWKRDFAGEFMDKYPDIRIVDYGFVWSRDQKLAGNDVTWFLMEKTPESVS